MEQKPADNGNAEKVSIAHYLMGSAPVEQMTCDLDQVEALGNLGAERRSQVIEVLAKAMNSRLNREIENRLAILMRELRLENKIAGARFLVDLCERIEYRPILLYRERARQARVEGDALGSLDKWTEALAENNDRVAIAAVASYIDDFIAANPALAAQKLSKFVGLVVEISPKIASSEAIFDQLEPQLERLAKVLESHELHADARTVGKVLIDLKIKWKVFI